MQKKHLNPNQSDAPIRKSLATRWEQSAWLGPLMIVLAALVVYSSTLSYSFQFDDVQQILENIRIRTLKPWWEYKGNRRTFFMFISALNYHFFEYKVAYWRVFNIAVHIGNALLVRWLVLLMFSTPVLKESPLSKSKAAIALFTALLFTVHPLATQSVTYIVQRANALCAFWYFLSVGLYLMARLATNPKRTLALSFAAIASAYLGFLTKENFYTLPLALALTELVLFQKSIHLPRKYYWVLSGLVLVFAAAAFRILNSNVRILAPIPPSPRNPELVTPLNYLYTQFSVIPKYIQLLILPIRQNFDYDYPLSLSLNDAKAGVGLVALLFLLGLAGWLLKRQRVAAFGIFWFFITLSIESSIIPLSDVINEHRTYLPSFGFFFPAVYGVFAIGRGRTLRYLLWALVAVYAFAAIQRNKVWKDPVTLWSDVIKKSPLKARGYNNRGAEYSERGQYELAVADFSNAIRLWPNYPLAYRNRSLAYFERQDWEKALQDANKAVEMTPKNADLYFTRGKVQYNLRQADLAMKDYNQAIALNPSFSDAYAYRGILYLVQKEWEKALSDFDTSLSLKPEQPEIRTYRDMAIKEIEKK